MIKIAIRTAQINACDETLRQGGNSNGKWNPPRDLAVFPRSSWSSGQCEVEQLHPRPPAAVTTPAPPPDRHVFPPPIPPKITPRPWTLPAIEWIPRQRDLESPAGSAAKARARHCLESTDPSVRPLPSAQRHR
jgi:hypothetical protein